MTLTCNGLKQHTSIISQLLGLGIWTWLNGDLCLSLSKSYSQVSAEAGSISSWLSGYWQFFTGYWKKGLNSLQAAWPSFHSVLFHKGLSTKAACIIQASKTVCQEDWSHNLCNLITGVTACHPHESVSYRHVPRSSPHSGGLDYTRVWKPRGGNLWGSF